jgi:hypothetical protein
MHFALALWVVALCLGLAQAAHAAPPSHPNRASPSAKAEPAEELEYDDYRLTLLANDAAAISLVITGAILEDNDTVTTALVAAGVGAYALGGPIIHLVHQQNARALQSFGLRVGLPGAGLLLATGMALSCGDAEGSEWCVYGAVVIGGVAAIGGILAAIIVDDAILGKAPKRQASKPAARPRSFQAGLAPLVDPKKGTVGLSLVGAF